MVHRRTTRSKRGGALLGTKSQAKWKAQRKSSGAGRNGAVVTYKAGDPKPPLPEPKNKKGSQRRAYKWS